MLTFKEVTICHFEMPRVIEMAVIPVKKYCCTLFLHTLANNLSNKVVVIRKKNLVISNTDTKTALCYTNTQMQDFVCTSTCSGRDYVMSKTVYPITAQYADVCYMSPCVPATPTPESEQGAVFTKHVE